MRSITPCKLACRTDKAIAKQNRKLVHGDPPFAWRHCPIADDIADGELCGSNKNIQVHHTHKLKDLRQRYQGRPEPPPWVVKHIQLNRKTIAVCADCRQRIHAGTYDGHKLKQGLLES